MLVSGMILSVASLLNLSLLALLLPMGLFAGLWLLRRPGEARRARGWIGGLVLFVAGLASLWLTYEVFSGTGIRDVWRVAMSYHLGLKRDYATWLGYHLYDFLLFLSIPLALLLVLAIGQALRSLLRGLAAGRARGKGQGGNLPPGGCAVERSYLDELTLAFGLGLVILALSGAARGEVARVWLFLTPFAALAAVRGLEHTRLGQRGFALAAILMAVQLFAFNAYLRVVTTGVEDPPSRTLTSDLKEALGQISHPLGATFVADSRQSIALLGYDVRPANALPGATIHLTLHWQALARMATPYTVFTHLVGPNDELVGQQDNMPVRDNVPTTCWVPGEIIADPYDIVVDSDAAEGTYVLSAGFYDLATGDRLPALGESASPDREVILADVAVGER
jgi:hypothetical protein